MRAEFLGGLRAIRAAHSRAAGALLAALPSLERPFISIGTAAGRRSRLLRNLYWFAEEDLARRLRASGNRFRRMSIAGADVFVDVTDGSAKLHYFHGEPYEPEFVARLPDLLKPGGVFIDVGAN